MPHDTDYDRMIAVLKDRGERREAMAVARRSVDKELEKAEQEEEKLAREKGIQSERIGNEANHMH